MIAHHQGRAFWRQVLQASNDRGVVRRHRPEPTDLTFDEVGLPMQIALLVLFGQPTGKEAEGASSARRVIAFASS